MAIYVGDRSAFEFWFGPQARARSISSYPVVTSLDDAAVCKRDVLVEDIYRLDIGTLPIHVYVGDLRAVRHNLRVHAHVWSAPYPAHSFVRVARDVFVEAPVPAIMRHSPHVLEFWTLLLLNQACGTYHVSSGRLQAAQPLVSVDEVKAYVEEAGRMRGAARVRKLLPRISSGAASPREAALAVLLRMSVRDGGFGLPPFELNHAIFPVQVGDPIRYGDFVWVLAWLILEYDSDQFHIGAEKIGQDSARRAQLQQAGYEVVTLTNAQIRDETEFLRVGNLLRARLGRNPLPTDDPAFMRAHRGLVRALFWQGSADTLSDAEGMRW